MAMCSSGSLGIISAPQGGCSSISVAVDGNTTPPKSLCALSVSAGLPAPHSMLEFYGYDTTPKMVTLVSTSSSENSSCQIIYGCIDVNPPLTSGNAFIFNTSTHQIVGETQTAGAFSNIKYICNDSQVYELIVYANGNYQECYHHPFFQVNYGDTFTFEVVACATDISGDSIVSTYLAMDLVQNVSGSFDYTYSDLSAYKPS
jgi:hypothetical protein